MTALEAHTNGSQAPALAVMPSASETNSAESNRGLLEELQVPFSPDLIRWRVHETRRIHGRLQGLSLPYADSRAYMDRLNLLLTAAGWTETYGVATTHAKILVTCRLTIPRLGCHSSTGEEWAANENALTAAQAQAFKRACSGFGLGRYLYEFAGVWLEIDREKRPKNLPQIPEWATPQGWKGGMRPAPIASRGSAEQQSQYPSPPESTAAPQGAASNNGKNVVREIQKMEAELGKPLYRWLLKDSAKVWSPEAIREIALQKMVLERMQAAERGVERLRIAAGKLSPLTIDKILRTLGLDSFDRIANFETLERAIFAFETAADL